MTGIPLRIMLTILRYYQVQSETLSVDRLTVRRSRDSRSRGGLAVYANRVHRCCFLARIYAILIADAPAM